MNQSVLRPWKYCAFVLLSIILNAPVYAQIQDFDLLNAPVDVSDDFKDFTNTYYFADRLVSFNPETASGEVEYKRHEYVTRQAFNNMLAGLSAVEANEFPGTEYEASPILPFSIQFVSDRTVRINMKTGLDTNPERESLMLVGGSAPDNRDAWNYEKIDGGHLYKSDHGSVTIMEQPWYVEIRDANGKLLTHTIHNSHVAGKTYTPVMPFCYVRRASDYSRSINAALSLAPHEKIFGCGESFTQFDKRGQEVVFFVDDANGTQNETMYKPVPFYMSSRGYGVFMHTSSPITCDFGKYYNEVNAMMIGDDELDLFLFLGDPKDVLDEYTDLTGKASMPPLWSFGFWMSRITYFSEEEGRQVAANLRKYEVPSDVIHFDTGWFGVDWRNDYQFADERFDDPEKMIADLKDDGFHISLWQLPYFTPRNTLFPEIIENDLAVKDAKGNIPYEDAVLDFSNPQTIDWYQDKIRGLLEMGAGAIKVDFGEAAPVNGLYHSGRTGFYEHNLYPLRYNKVVADVTEEVHGNGFIWARSTWAGSQRYPVHWGGDAANTDGAMLATLRGGLSLGLSGFSFWSHDIGGFVQKASEDVYDRWTPFGMLTSHVRSHGAPPTEPWEYGDEFLKRFRKADEMRYKLMPYIYAQAKHSAENGLPMVRALFVEYPDDPGSWQVDDEYLFGSDMLVAPLFEDVTSRDVYLPKGDWIDYQTGKRYEGGWHHIEAGAIPVVMLVRAGAVIPHIKLAQSTMDMDWSELELVAFSDDPQAKGYVCLPEQQKLEEIVVDQKGKSVQLAKDPYGGKVDFKLKHYSEIK